MEIKNNQLTIDIPEGMEIDILNSNFSTGVIRFKKKQLKFKDGDIVAVDLDRKNIRIFKKRRIKIIFVGVSIILVLVLIMRENGYKHLKTTQLIVVQIVLPQKKRNNNSFQLLKKKVRLGMLRRNRL